jgi:hypothetical protein
MGWFRNLGKDRPWAQGCVIAAAGLMLAATSCVGMIFSFDMSGQSSLGGLLTGGVTVLFGISLLAIPAGFIWFIVGLVRNASRAGTPPPLPPIASEQQKPEPPGPAA